MRMLFLLICAAFIALLFAACRHSATNSAQSTGDTLLGKTIIFPDQLLRMKGDVFLHLDSFINVSIGKTKIVSIIDGTCSACIVNQMNKLDSLFSTIVLDSDLMMVFILNVSRNDSSYFMLNMQPIVNVKGTILWDNNFNFERENNLFTPDINLRTFMVNPENRIIQYGNPLMHPDVIWEYKAKLENNM